MQRGDHRDQAIGDKGHVAVPQKHDPEKWIRFSERIMLKQKWNSGGRYHASGEKCGGPPIICRK
jgi:hypothetical protein